METNCLEFPNLNFALDWAETQLLNKAYNTQQSFAVTERDDASVEIDTRDMSFTKLGKG